MIRTPRRDPARILFHLNGTAKVIMEDTVGYGQANGAICFDVPLDVIPIHLRGIGSRFLLLWDAITPEPHDSIEDLRAAIGFQVEEHPQD